MLKFANMKSAEESSDSSDSEEETEVLKKVLTRYKAELGKNDSYTSLENFLKGKDNGCLICLSAIRRVQAIWTCKLCHRMFHLVCIQQWAKDGVLLRTRDLVLSEDLFPSIAAKWSCPACRGDYSKLDTPKEYKCFCGKKVNPSPDPWLLAHSCGEVCGHDLVPHCGHHCLALCHPGPCPPCPKTLLLKCHCQRSEAVARRCGSEGWSCGKGCRSTLSCGLHLCEQTCHTGSCGPCMVEITLSCKCGKQTEEKACSEFGWSCEKECGKVLSCGHHLCTKLCHVGSCGDCPLRINRTCPCGKKKVEGDCSTAVPCCGDTCSKTLECGRHVCMRTCHVGECGACVQRIEKSCRCGIKVKSLLCGQEVLCDNRCQKMRQCGRHQCRRKCCAGACPPCEQFCGRQLGCKNHKCSAPCHSGRCYPCVQLVDVVCACGMTKLSVACGRERSIKRPRCRQPCSKPSKCHPTFHHCHDGDCPPCKHKCGKILKCQHHCVATCHSRPHVVVQDKPMAPWKKKGQTLVVDGCPPCMVAVSKSCFGGHEIMALPCSQARLYPCGRLCGRLLQCGNHTCSRGCHQVLESPANNQAGEDCLECEEPCTKPCPADCTHGCPLPCHTGSCPPCEAQLKFSCHCSNISIYISCREWCEAHTQQRDCLRSCNSQCLKLLSCGHTCTKSCHAGPCTPTIQCTRKVVLRCPCRRIKKDMRCNEQQDVVCDQECEQFKINQQKESDRAAAEAKSKKEKKERAVLEEIERQLRPRKRKRKVKTEDEKHLADQKRTGYHLIIYFCILCLVGLIAYFTLNLVIMPI